MSSNYDIGDHFESFIKSQIQQGRYASASEVILSLRAEIRMKTITAIKARANTLD